MVLPSPNFAQANFVFAGVAAPTGAEITLGFDRSGTGSTPQVEADQLVQYFDDDPAHQLSSSLTFVEVQYKVGPDATGGTYFSAGTGALYANAAAVPPQVAVLVNKVTNLGGREGRGRMFVPGIPESSVTSAGEVDGSVLGDWQDAWDAFFAACVAFELLPALLHRSATAPSLLDGFVVGSKVATIRDRLRR